MKYRKKPIIIEAIQCHELQRIEKAGDDLPLWLKNLFASKYLRWGDDGILYISTLEGVMRAERDDWIICGTKGEVYPCKPDIFNTVYEPA